MITDIQGEAEFGTRQECGLSVLNLFEILAVCGIVFSFGHFVNRVLGGGGEIFAWLCLAYALKISLTFLGTKRPLMSMVAYLILSASVVGLLIQKGAEDREATWIELYVCLPAICLTVPTVSFLIDLTIRSTPNLRILIWRSVMEIVIYCPVGSIVYVFTSLMFRGWLEEKGSGLDGDIES